MNIAEYGEKCDITDRKDDYQNIVDRFGKKEAKLLHGLSGMSTESGEALDAFKKSLFYDKPLDTVNILEECGDMLWFMHRTLKTIGYTIEDAMERNAAKLAKRYDGGFTEDKARNRDLESERKILEQ